MQLGQLYFHIISNALKITSPRFKQSMFKCGKGSLQWNLSSGHLHEDRVNRGKHRNEVNMGTWAWDEYGDGNRINMGMR